MPPGNGAAAAAGRARALSQPPAPSRPPRSPGPPHPLWRPGPTTRDAPPEQRQRGTLLRWGRDVLLQRAREAGVQEGSGTSRQRADSASLHARPQAGPIWPQPRPSPLKPRPYAEEQGLPGSTIRHRRKWRRLPRPGMTLGDSAPAPGEQDTGQAPEGGTGSCSSPGTARKERVWNAERPLEGQAWHRGQPTLWRCGGAAAGQAGL